MLDKIIECVPNFSEGRDKTVIDQITAEIKNVEGVELLDVDPGYDMNRTVVTFIGTPEAVKTAAFNAIKKAAELIDMSNHHGAHPRMGATDVCPFVPVSGISTEECIKASEELAQRVGEELQIPVYLYEKSARIPQRRNLAFIRMGEYEALAQKLNQAEWKPDYGPQKFNSRSGATVIGVREFLIAYNISLNTSEVKYATDIALELREKGRSVRRGNTVPFYFKGQEVLKYKPAAYPCGSCDFIAQTISELIGHCSGQHAYNLVELLQLNGINPQKPEGQSVKKPGQFTHCKAIGWMVPRYQRAQISINLTDYKVTPIHAVLEETRLLAAKRGLVVTGSEVVGMIPFDALLESGKYYLRRQGRSTGIPTGDILEVAVQSMGLRDTGDFDIAKRVLGLPRWRTNEMIQLNIRDFVDEVSRESPAPGGGAISALAGALGAALSSMVANLAIGKRGSEQVEESLKPIAERAQQLKDRLLKAIDEDTNAFNRYLAARKMPAAKAEDKKKKEQAMLDGLKQATAVPLTTARNCYEVLELIQVVAEKGNPDSLSDAGVGAHLAFAGVKGAILNVLINLQQINDPKFNQKMITACKKLENDADKILNHLLPIVEEKIRSRGKKEPEET
jgi:glutamate formiminotransferase/formiminotetrahydrofolate cyclodeaminase